MQKSPNQSFARMNECLTTPQHEKQIGYWEERKEEVFYLTMHSTHFIYGYMSTHGKVPLR